MKRLHKRLGREASLPNTPEGARMRKGTGPLVETTAQAGWNAAHPKLILSYLDAYGTRLIASHVGPSSSRIHETRTLPPLLYITLKVSETEIWPPLCRMGHPFAF